MQSDFQRIGSILREKREEKGLSIIDISDILCLRKSLVQALEEGNTAILPHTVYIRGYLKKYAHILDISEETLGLAARLEERAVQTQAESEPGRITSAIHKPRHIAKRAIVVPLVLVLIVAFFVLNQIYKERSVTRSGQGQAAQSNPVSTKQASVNVRQSSAANTTTQAGGAEQSRVLAAQEIKKLMITCNERTWVSVVIDENEKKEFMLNPEEMIVLNAKENFDLLIGNAAGVKLNLNGKEVGFTGKNGEVKRVKIS
jgi:cytoskeleton protein RodZ